MEGQKANTMPVIIKWAAINVIASIVLSYTIQFLNMSPDSPLKWLGTIIFIALMLVLQKECRDVNGGHLTFGEGFKAGFLYAIFSGIVLTIFTYLYFTVLSPEMVDKLLETARASLESKNLSQEQMDQAMGFTRKVINPTVLTISVAFSYVFLGAIVALIGAAIFKKDRPPFIAADNYEDPAEPTV